MKVRITKPVIFSKYGLHVEVAEYFRPGGFKNNFTNSKSTDMTESDRKSTYGKKATLNTINDTGTGVFGEQQGGNASLNSQSRQEVENETYDRINRYGSAIHQRDPDYFEGRTDTPNDSAKPYVKQQKNDLDTLSDDDKMKEKAEKRSGEKKKAYVSAIKHFYTTTDALRDSILRRLILIMMIFMSSLSWAKELSDEELSNQAEQFKQGMLSLYTDLNNIVEKIDDHTARLYYFDLSVFEQTQLAKEPKKVTKQQQQKRLKLISKIQNEKIFKELLYGMVVLEAILQGDFPTMQLLHKKKSSKDIYDAMDASLRSDILNAFKHMGNVYAYGDGVLYEHRLPKDPRFNKPQVLSEDFLDFRIGYFKEKNIAYKYDEEYPEGFTVKNPVELDTIRRDIFDAIGDIIEEEFAQILANESRDITVTNPNLQTNLNLQTMMSRYGLDIETQNFLFLYQKRNFTKSRYANLSEDSRESAYGRKRTIDYINSDSFRIFENFSRNKR